MDEVKVEETVQAQPQVEATPTIEELQAEIARLKAQNEQTDKLKKSVSEACADAAEWKRKYRATLDEAERAKQEQAEQLETLKRENATYKAEKRETAYFAKLIEAGFSPETAKSMAEGLPEGVPDSFFDNQKSFLEATKQAVKTQTLNSQPGLSTGMPPTSAVVDQTDNEMRKWFGLPTK